MASAPTWLVSSHDTGGTLSMLRQTLAPGHAPPTHVHEITTPGGFADFHLGAGEEPTHGGMPEQRAPDVERMVNCSGEYGCTILGPPPE